MREVLIKAIPFDDLKITELEGVQQVNEHGELVFSGLMRGEKESEYISWALKKNPLVSVNVCSDSGEEKILFQGVLVDFEIQAQNDVRYLTGVLRRKSFSPLGACCLPIMPGCPSNCLMQRELRLSATRQSLCSRRKLLTFQARQVPSVSVRHSVLYSNRAIRR